MIRFAAPALLLALAACSGDEADTDEQASIPVGTQVAENGVMSAPANGTAPAIPTASGPGTAFGMTTDQLDDADLLDAAGATLAEVERVTTDQQGNVNGIVVEVEGTGREVRLPLAGIEPVARGSEWHLRANDLTRERLNALPAM